MDGSFAPGGGSRERGRAAGESGGGAGCGLPACLAAGGGALRGESRGGAVLPLASESDGQELGRESETGRQ